MSRRKTLMKLCESICPEGTTYWTMPNKITFQFVRSFKGLGLSYVSVTVTRTQTGELVTLWDSHRGFLVRDPLLINWVDEGISLLQKQHEKSKADQIKEHTLLQASLIQDYSSRFTSPDSTSSME